MLQTATLVPMAATAARACDEPPSYGRAVSGARKMILGHAKHHRQAGAPDTGSIVPAFLRKMRLPRLEDDVVESLLD